MQVHSFSLILFNILFASCDNLTEKYNCDVTVTDIASALVTLLGADEKNIRIRKLKDNLKKIDSFVIDKEKYDEFLLNETMSTNLNETNFYNALNETDHFRFLLEKEPKNLYLKLKEKLNRDDIMKILSEKKGIDKFSKSARKMMSNNIEGEDNNHDVIEELVDKMIAKIPTDQHKFNFRTGDDKHWDPKRELEDLKEYHQHDGRRIFKGERTTIRYYPFMVSVHVMGSFWCGGVIYWHDLVLTSAACLQLMHNNRFFRENPSVLKVRIGSNHSRIGGESVEALEVFFHPGYNPRTLRHNIAIIRLRRHLFFSYHRIPKIIDISHESAGLAPTSEVLLLGWGVTKILPILTETTLTYYGSKAGCRSNVGGLMWFLQRYRGMSQKLHYEPVFLNRKIIPIYPNVFCKDVYGKKFITETMFCAGTLTTGEGACDHDAGGPAIIAGKLVGIISFGPTVCGFPNIPTVFTLVGAYVDWIENVNESMPTYYRGKKRTTTLKPATFPEYKIKKLYQDITGLTIDEDNTKKTLTTPSDDGTRHRQVMVADDSDKGFSIDID